ncbi:hypothetical protein QFC19_001661 [Naganishia cerealis]|uniref:Uncharacterized protein n=1 Tax=Naganishia cerealis TaxID=610337 RepID=A0ACC2WEU1_9TREE|nr:hypothetical protein QFC19_001661 [Naganishia cerealis]
MTRPTVPLDLSSSKRLSLPAPLLRSDSHTSQHSIHSQRSHSSQTHHVTPSDPTTLANLLPSVTSDEEADFENNSSPNHSHYPHVHAQHKNLFVAQDGPTGMPSFEELLVTEQRDSMEGDLEDNEQDERERESENAKAKHRAVDQSPRRRRSVAFLEESSAKQAVRKEHEGVTPSKPDNSTKSSNHPSSSSPSSSSSRTCTSQKGDSVKASETDPLLPSKQSSYTTEPGDDPEYDPTKDPEEWARIREGSIARRSRWRRPGPYWYVYSYLKKTITSYSILSLLEYAQ